MISTILTIAGIFAGIGIFLATMYSFSQILLLKGTGRIAHAIAFVLILSIMAALMERFVPIARILAVPLFGVAIWLMVLEPRWFRIFPILIMLFSILLIMGYVALN
ncbi:MAG: hypothetical protein AAF439_10680 [Pseudomonadota bacterium]